MSVTKEANGKWMSRVQDWTGKVVHKKKRGFATKKAALEWEHDFLNKAKSDTGMRISLTCTLRTWGIV